LCFYCKGRKHKIKKNMWFQLNPNKKYGRKLGRRDIGTSTVLIEKSQKNIFRVVSRAGGLGT
jgi:hypothetical protein